MPSTTCAKINRKNKRAGAYRGLLDNVTRPERNCCRDQTRNKAAAPASKVNVDHSSTAPIAKTPNTNKATKPKTCKDERGLDSSFPVCAGCASSAVVSTIT